MKRFLTTTQIAADLNVTVNELQAQIRRGEFVAADAVTGRVQGWRPATIEAWKQTAKNTPPTSLNTDELLECAAQLSSIAETVRTYGQAHIPGEHDSPAFRADKIACEDAARVAEDIVGLAISLRWWVRSSLAGDAELAAQIQSIGFIGHTERPKHAPLKEVPVPAYNDPPLLVYIDPIDPLEKAEHLQNAALALENLAATVTVHGRPNRKIDGFAVRIRDIADEIIIHRTALASV